ncbi:MAG: hypothetical protein IKR73_03725 [Oscillospiraceae bacterium]|nr:hypothetical protein [Oscillospiraceae bacterium]
MRPECIKRLSSISASLFAASLLLRYMMILCPAPLLRLFSTSPDVLDTAFPLSLTAVMFLAASLDIPLIIVDIVSIQKQSGCETGKMKLIGCAVYKAVLMVGSFFASRAASMLVHTLGVQLLAKYGIVNSLTAMVSPLSGAATLLMFCSLAIETYEHERQMGTVRMI